MEKYKKIVLPILAGIGYECLSLLWIVVAVTFTFPGTSFGSWDLKEDVLFIPIGIIMLLLYVLTLGVIVFKMRKKGKELALFILAAILTAGVVFGIRGMEKTEQPASKDTTISDNEKMTTQDAGDEDQRKRPLLPGLYLRWGGFRGPRLDAPGCRRLAAGRGRRAALRLHRRGA